MGPVLPDDVLLLIGEHLQHSAGRWNLILASRHFHDLFLPLAYRVVSLENYKVANSFFHTITNRPSLASAVRIFFIGKWPPEGPPGHFRDEIWKSTALNDRLDDSTHSTNEKTQWREDLMKGFSDAWVALILPLLSQLRELHLAHAINTPFLDRIMQRAIAGEMPFLYQPAFQHLREVSLFHDTNEHETKWTPTDLPSSILLRFFRLPSMRKILANSWIDCNALPSNIRANNEASPAGFSPITEIEIRASGRNQGINTLISSCANLQSFKYRHSDADVRSSGYRPTSFYRFLARSKGTLQTLWLDQYGKHYAFTRAGLNQTHDEWFGSLADFTALRDLRIRLPNLLDIRYQGEPSTPLEECLPSSLERLFIEGCEERDMPILVSQLQSVVRNRRSRVPNLQRVDLEGAFRIPAPDEFGNIETFSSSLFGTSVKRQIRDMVEPLDRDCIATGIELHLHDRVFAWHLHSGVSSY